MRFRVVLTFALILGLFAAPAFAQLSVTGGVKGGVGFGTYSIDTDVDVGLEDSRTGFIIGGFVETPLSNMFSLVIEVLYNQKGATGSLTDGIDTVDLTSKYDVIELPILANFPINTMSNIRPFVYGGIAPAFAVSRKIKFEFGGEELEEDDETIKSFDMGLVFGGGVLFGQFGVEGRYNLGLMDLNDIEGATVSIKTRQFAFLVSYSFPR